MSKEVVSTTNAPAAIGPYSQAIKAGGFLFISGQIPLDPATGTVVPGCVGCQAEQSLKNLSAILASQGLTTADVVKTTVLLADIADFAAVNEVYASVFSEPYPARSCFAVAALPMGGFVEIEVIAVL